MVDKYSKNIDIQDISLFWQLTIKTIDDLRIVSNENLTLEMYIIQLVHLKSLGVEKKDTGRSEQEILSRENYSSEKIEEKNIETKLSNGTKSQLKSTDQIKTSPIKKIKSPNDK